jgi:hypothetical protein
MSNNNLTYEIPIIKKKIIDTIINKGNNKFIYLASTYCKLLTSVSSKKYFNYSGLKGGLFFYLNIENKCYDFILYDLNTFKILFKIELKRESFEYYKKLKKNFYYLEIPEGFIGFYFYNLIESDEIYKICDNINKKFETEQKIKTFIKKYTEKQSKDIDYLYDNLKNQLRNNINTNIQNDNNEKILDFNLNKIKIITKCVDYNSYKNKFEFIGNKNDFNLIISDNLINKGNIDFEENNLKIKDKTQYINLLTNHMLNSQYTQKVLSDKILDYKRNKISKNNK